ncbi:MAG: TRAP transporter large permease subunit, partial [Chloroflexota bacterium]|nr:TRAP transporter large permease subunit [Chloroflexota bacterium]
GAVAFLMAEIIGVPYIQVCIAAAIPAIIYFASIFMQVDSEALRHDLRGVSKDEVPPWRELGIGFLQFFGPVVWMVWRLFDNYSPARVALETIVFVMAITLVRRRGRIKLQEIIDACYGSIKTNFVVAAGAAAGGMIVGIIALTGVGAKFSALILSMAGNNMFFALFLTAVVAILLGLAMNITPSYILVAALAGPALITGGIAPMSAHLFMVYYAVTASITPPVAMTAFTAATIAGADPMATGWRGFRLAIAAYIVPFCFVYRPALINFAPFDLFATAEAVVLSVAALYALISAMDKTLTGGKLLARLLLGIAFVTLMIPDNYLLSAVGLVILAGVWYWDYLWRKAGNSIRMTESF